MNDLRKTLPRSASRLGAAIIVVLALAPFTAAQAYVGPGAGLSLLGALWGVVAAVAAALLFVLTWPLRRMRRRPARPCPASSRTPAPTPTF